MCNERYETTFHILGEYGNLAQCEYKERHDKVAQLAHQNLCCNQELPHAQNWYDHVTEIVVENNKIEVLRYFTIQTSHVLQEIRPNILVLDKELDHV